MFIKIDDDIQLNFTPQTEEEEIIQNIKLILSINKGEQPLDRELGIDSSFVDSPINIVKAKTTAAALEAIEKYEPRATVISIDFENFDASLGKSTPRLEVEFNVSGN